MMPINSFLNRLFSPLYNYAHFLLRITLGISFFLHGYGKFKIIDGFTSFLGSQGILYPKLMTYLVAWGEMLAGITIIIGGLLIKSLPVISNLLTRLSGAGVIVIMISALIIAHSDWNIFIGERGKILFASEQLFLLTIGLYFFIKGND
jgi:Predicted membrane protein